MFTDETNVQQSKQAKFFAYGGLIVSAESIRGLSARIEKIRNDIGYKPEDVLKFDTNARPSQVTPEGAKVAKREVIKACIDANCRFIVTVVLHDVAKNQESQALIEQGANSVIAKFNGYLGVMDSHGAVIVDRLPSATEYGYLTAKFQKGLAMPGDTQVRLDRIALFASTCSGASHCSSAMDIVLGAFRFCINSPKNMTAAAEMMAAVTNLIWHTRDGDNIYAHERGLLFRPKTVKVASYKAEYDALLEWINQLLTKADAETPPTSA